MKIPLSVSYSKALRKRVLTPKSPKFKWTYLMVDRHRITSNFSAVLDEAR